MTTTKNTRQQRDLFASLQRSTRCGSITIEWFGPKRDTDSIPVDLIDTVHITSTTGSRTTYRFEPGDTRVSMLLDACDVAWNKGHTYALNPFGAKD